MLGVGVATAWRQLVEARGLNKLVSLGPAFVAAPLAAFGAEHQFAAPFIANGVPGWIPWHLFWAYFVGVALIAAGLSIAAQVLVRWSALLAGCMVAVFVVTIHLPNVVTNPKDRFLWIVMFRDLAFASGLWALAASRMPGWRDGSSLTRGVVFVVSRYLGALMIFFGVEHWMFPAFCSGVPLQKVMPGWVPVPSAWNYLVGALLIAGGVAMLLDLRVFRARTAAIAVGGVLAGIVVFLYLPILLMDSGTAAIVEGLNYVADTLLMAGVLLVTAGGNGKILRDPVRS